jgi:hypothetical protein
LKIKCKDDCNNKGICNTSGKCGCNKGYFGVSCENKEFCPNNCTSKKNGKCEKDGKCLCNKSFEGDDCSIEKSKNKIKANKSSAFISLKTKEIQNKNINENINENEFLKQNLNFRFSEIHNDIKNTTININQNQIQNIGKFKAFKEKENEKRITLTTITTTATSSSVTTFNKNKGSIVIDGITYEEIDLQKCPNRCSEKGRCLGGVCFCKQGSTGTDCSLKYIDVINYGFDFVFALIVMVAFLFVGLLVKIVHKMYDKHNKKYDDHLNLD